MTRTRIILTAFGLAVCGACSLNPQPFPPGPERDPNDQTGATSDGGSGSDAFSPSPDSGNEDSGVMSNDAGDAGLDAPVDAPFDSPVDAPELDADPDGSIVNDN